MVKKDGKTPALYHTFYNHRKIPDIKALDSAFFESKKDGKTLFIVCGNGENHFITAKNLISAERAVFRRLLKRFGKAKITDAKPYASVRLYTAPSYKSL